MTPRFIFFGKFEIHLLSATMTAKSGYFDDRKPPRYHYSKLPVSRALVISVTVALVLVQAGCENQVEEPKPIASGIIDI